MQKNYFEVNAMSASAIKAGNKSMLNMQHYITNGIKTSAAMATGTLRHMAVLEQDKFRALTVDDTDRRRTAFKELAAEVGKENIIKSSEYTAHMAAAEMVRTHKAVKELGLFREGEAEKEVYWNHNEYPCKCKIDWFADDYIVEFKSTANLDKFINASAGMAYHLQLGWYWYGASTVDGNVRKVYVVAQEQAAPYDVVVYEVPELSLMAWYNDALDIFNRFLSGDRSGVCDSIITFELPAWAHNDIELEAEQIQF